MKCSKSILNVLRREYAAVGISLKGVSDEELQDRINANMSQFKAVGYSDDVCGNIDELALAYSKSRKNK